MEEKKELLRIANFIIELQSRSENDSAVVIRDVAGTWSMSIEGSNTMFGLWMEICEHAKENKDLELAMDATIRMVYLLGTAGIHDPKLTNGLCEAYDGYVKRLNAQLDKLHDKAQEEADAEDWMKQQEVLDSMAEAVSKESEADEQADE